jgi:cytochrome c-type biogenesis protein CcmH/NrfG
MRRGNLDEAGVEFQDALRIDPAMVDPHYNLGHVSKLQGKLADAVQQFEEALRLEPDGVATLTSLAWIFGTSSDAAVRDPDQAQRLAQRAVDLTGHGDVGALDALAAAFAAAGQFDRALDVVEEAVGLGPEQPLAREIETRRELYKRREPYREP